MRGKAATARRGKRSRQLSAAREGRRGGGGATRSRQTSVASAIPVTTRLSYSQRAARASASPAARCANAK
eukprot:5275352-Alexandrium_andersonii.AAC.1